MRSHKLGFLLRIEFIPELLSDILFSEAMNSFICVAKEPECQISEMCGEKIELFSFS